MGIHIKGIDMPPEGQGRILLVKGNGEVSDWFDLDGKVIASANGSIEKEDERPRRIRTNGMVECRVQGGRMMGVYIPYITVDMLRNAPLEAVEELLNSGVMIDVKEPHGRLIEEVIDFVNLMSECSEKTERLISLAEYKEEE